MRRLVTKKRKDNLSREQTGANEKEWPTAKPSRWSEWPQDTGDHLAKLELGCLHLIRERGQGPLSRMNHNHSKDQGGLAVSVSPGVLVKQTDPHSPLLTNKGHLQG